MRNFIYRTVLASLFLCAPYLAQAGELSYLTNSGKPIKVFLGNFSNESGEKRIRTEDFKATFSAALLNRKSVKFEIVDSIEKSNVQISVVIKKYKYLKNDPINSFAGPSALVLDAATSENYVDMEAFFTVVDTRTGKAVWSQTLSAYREKMMTPGESIPIIYEKLSRIFLWRSFGKPR